MNVELNGLKNIIEERKMNKAEAEIIVNEQLAKMYEEDIRLKQEYMKSLIVNSFDTIEDCNN